MTGRYQAYPEYKDSGKDYYGNVPLHWSLERIKYNSYVKGRQGWQNLRAEEYQDVGPYLVTGSHFDNEGGVDWGQCYRVSEERYNRDKDIWIEIDDVLMTKDGTIGKIAYIDNLPGQACLNSHLLIIRDLYQRYDQRFLYYLLGSSCFKSFIGERQTGTTFYGITQEAVEEFPLLICPVNEQHQIANFLDHETAKIDTLIKKQQKLIALLKEKRQAVISHAVTKGLNPDGPMKDSGVEWLGEVPAHWLISRIKFFCRLNPSKSQIINSMHPDTEVTFLPMEAIGEFGQIDRSREKSLKALQSGYTYVGEGDVCIAKITPCFENGKGAVATGLKNGVAFATTEVIPLRCNQIDDSRYLYYLLTSLPFKKIAEGSMYGAGGQKRVSDNFVANYSFPLPPFTERKHIVAFLNIETAKIDILIDKAQRSIDLSKERRTALISAAVTGKIDVRNWQPPPAHKETQ